MQIPGSLQAAGATVLTRTIGASARLLEQRDNPEALHSLVRRESILMAATGVLTYAVHELFDRVIIPEVSKSSLLVKNQTLWRAVLSIPGLLVIEWLSRRFFTSNPQTQFKSHKHVGLEQKFTQFIQKAKRQRAVVHQVTQSHIAPIPPLKEQNGLTVFA
jgi:hypothetical protein